MNIKAEYIVGKNSGNDWSGFYGYIPDVDSDTKTELLCVARLKTDATDVELERIAGMLLDEFQDAYYNLKIDEDEIVKLEESFQKMKTKLEVIVSREDSILDKGLDIEMTIALVNGDMLVVGVIGESKILIYRNEKLVDISKGLIDANMLGFVKTGSLKLEPDDRILLSTSTPFAKQFDKLLLATQDLSINSLGDISEELGSAVLLFADESAAWKSYVVESEQDSAELMPIDEPVADLSFEPESDISHRNENEPTAFNEGVGEQGVAHTAFDDSEVELMPEEPEVRSTLSPINRARTMFKGVMNKLPMNENRSAGHPKLLPDGGNQGTEKVRSFPDFEENMDEQPMNESKNTSGVFGQIKNRAISLKRKFASKSPNSKPEFSEDKTYKQVFKSVTKSIQRILKSAIEFLKVEVIGLNVSRMDKRRNASKLRRNRVILAIVMVLLIILIYSAWRSADLKRQDAEKVQAASTKISQIETEVNQAIGQVESVKTQDQSKKDILNTKLTTLSTSIDTQRKDGLFIDQLDRLASKIKNAKDALMYIKEVNDSNIQLITDVGKLFQDTNLNDLALVNGQLYASDSKRNVVYKITPTLNATAQEAIKNLTIPTHLLKDASNNLVVFDSDTTSSIGVFKTSDNTFSKLVGLTPAVIGTVDEAAIYANNDAIYELHQNHQQIFKRDKLGETYSGGGAIYVTINPPNWKSDPAFGKAIDIAVPYEIYVLIEGTGLQRYLAGENNTLTFDTYQNFSQADFESIKQATSFDIAGKYLAVSDPKNKRVMVFEIIESDQKEIKFLQQYVYRGSGNTFSNIKEVAIDDSSAIIYVLDGSKIVKLSI